MKNPELFHKTIGILVNAYLNETLQHVNCYACAVGNIVAANMGYKFKKVAPPDSIFPTDYTQDIVWEQAKNYSDESIENWFGAVVMKRGATPVVEKQIASTGYSLLQLSNIEDAFEGGNIGVNSDERMFNRLMAVCDTLMHIHEANEEEIKIAKSLFVKELTD